MNRFKMLASVMVATFACITSAQAACTQAQVNNKGWKASFYEATTGTEIFCSFRTTTTGTINAVPAGCETARAGVNVDFSALTPFDIGAGGSIALVAGKACTYDMTLVIGATTFKNRVLLGANKQVANGTWLASGLGGTIAMTRQ